MVMKNYGCELYLEISSLEEYDICSLVLGLAVSFTRKILEVANA